MKYKPLFKCLHGSHLYGLNTPESDKDFKGVFMPDINELLLGTSPKQISTSTGSDTSKNTSEDIDTTWYSLPEFIKLACQGETIAIDMLHSHTNASCVLHTSPEWKYIVSNNQRFISKDMKAFVGYAKKQAHKYGVKGSRMGALEEVIDAISIIFHKYSTKELFRLRLRDVVEELPHNKFCNRRNSSEFYTVLEANHQLSIRFDHFVELMYKKWEVFGERTRLAKNNEGVDWKAISHALRAALQLEELYETGRIQYPLKDKDFLLKVKQGQLDFTTEVQPVLETLIASVEGKATLSDYPDKVDKDFWDKWLLSVYNGTFYNPRIY